MQEHISANFTRYLAWRDTKSSSATLGLRIEGTTINGKSSRDYKATCTRDQVSKVLRTFIGHRRNRVSRRSVKYFSVNPHITYFKMLSFVYLVNIPLSNFQDMYLDRLKLIQDRCIGSPFFSSHELIGSSLLFIHDDTKVSKKTSTTNNSVSRTQVSLNLQVQVTQ